MVLWFLNKVQIMIDETKIFVDKAKRKMQNAVIHLEGEFSRVRAGKINPSMLDGIKVDYYGELSPLNQVASIKNIDAKTIIIQPWEKNLLGLIEKSILAANIGFTPINDGNTIRLVMPPLTEERRKELVKKVKEIAEQSRVSVRNSRRDANVEIRGLIKQGVEEDIVKIAEHETQNMTDEHIKIIDKHLLAKENEIMTV